MLHSYYYSQKDTILNRLITNTGMGHGPRQTPTNTVQLLTSTVKMDEDEASSSVKEGGGLRFVFRLVSPAAIYTLQAESEGDRGEWVEAVQVGFQGFAG